MKKGGVVLIGIVAMYFDLCSIMPEYIAGILPSRLLFTLCWEYRDLKKKGNIEI